MRDAEDVTRSLYGLLRTLGSPVTQAQAYFIMRRTETRATFIAGPDGVVIPRLARLAELRLLALRQFPLATVARFDR